MIGSSFNSLYMYGIICFLYSPCTLTLLLYVLKINLCKATATLDLVDFAFFMQVFTWQKAYITPKNKMFLKDTCETSWDLGRSSRGVLFQCLWEGEEILWILPVWAQGSQSEQGGLVWELLLICVTHTHTMPDSLCTNNVDFSFCGGGTGDREEKEEAQWIKKTGNQSSDNAAVPHRKAAFIEPPSPPR